MSIVTISINNKNFQLSCLDGQEEALINLAATLNEKILEIKKHSPAASPELLLIMVALSLQDKVQTMSAKLMNVTENSPNIQEEEKFAQTLSTIAGYLENLAKKMTK